MVNKYLAKLFYIIEKYLKQKNILPNDVKLRINVIDQLDTYFFMVKNKAVSSVANIIKNVHIQKNMYLIYKQDLYKGRKKEIGEIFIGYLVPIMENLDRPDLV